MVLNEGYKSYFKSEKNRSKIIIQCLVKCQISIKTLQHNISWFFLKSRNMFMSIKIKMAYVGRLRPVYGGQWKSIRDKTWPLIYCFWKVWGWTLFTTFQTWIPFLGGNVQKCYIRKELRWQNRNTLSSPPPTNTSKLQLRIGQLLLRATWRLAEGLFYNQGCKERTTQSLAEVI